MRRKKVNEASSWVFQQKVKSRLDRRIARKQLFEDPTMIILRQCSKEKKEHLHEQPKAIGPPKKLADKI
jgi:hypothetical protein